MAVDFSTLVLGPNFDMWARPITVDPVASQPGMPSYTARGIYDSGAINVPMDDGSIFSDQQTILDILEAEFVVPPVQNDLITIPVDPGSDLPGLGVFQVTDCSNDGGGEITLTLRKLTTAG